MSALRCERCGAALPASALVCGVCHTLVIAVAAPPLAGRRTTTSAPTPPVDAPTDDPFSPRTTVIDDVLVVTTADPLLDAPTVSVRPLRHTKTQPDASTAGGSAPWLEEAPALPIGDDDPFDPFAPRAAGPLHAALVLPGADGVVLGDAGDIVGSALVGPAAYDAFLASPTEAGLRAVLPVRVYLGRNIAEALTPDVILRPAADLDTRLVPLSSVERAILAEIDGKRPVARLRVRVGLDADAFGVALALLLDKRAIEVAGVALRAMAPSAPQVTFFAAAPTPAVEHTVVAVADVTAPPAPPLRAAHSIFASLLDEIAAPEPPPPRRPDPARAAALHAQALRDLQTGDLTRAWQLASLAAQLDPEHPRYRATIERWSEHVSRATAGRGDADEARLYGEAIAREDAGDVAGALALLRRAVTAHPEHAPSWNRLGVLLLRERDVEAAIAAFERAVLLDADDATYRNNLGKVLALDEAGDAAERVTRRLRGT